MSNESSVAVIVPALDEEREIVATLESVGLDEDHDIIVVDGGSRDATKAAAAGFGARVIDSAPGRARQMNAGAQATDARVLLFLHADTRLPQGWSALVRGAIDDGAVAGRFDVQLRGRHPMLRVVAAFMNARSRWSRIYTGDQAIFVRRSVFESIGGYPPIPLMEDIALSRRLKQKGPIACLSARVCTSGRRWETHGVFRTIGLMWWLRFAYFVGVSPERLAAMYRAGKL